MARIIPIAIVGLALVLYALWRGAYPDLFEETEPPAAVETAPTAETAPPAEAPAESGTPPAAAPPPAPDKPPLKPELDVVRINEDGDTVIAGKAEPGASVTIATQDGPLATVKADERGKWVALPEQPLPAGDHAVRIEATGKNGKKEVGDKTIVVSIPEGAGRKPLVVAVPTKDFGASDVLQRPEGPAGAEVPAAPAAGPEKPPVLAEAPKEAVRAAGTASAGSEPREAAAGESAAQGGDAGARPPAGMDARKAEDAAEAAADRRGAPSPAAAEAPASGEPPAPPAGSATQTAQRTATGEDRASPEDKAGDTPPAVAQAPAKPEKAGADDRQAAGGRAPPEDRAGDTPPAVAQAPAKPERAGADDRQAVEAGGRAPPPEDKAGETPPAVAQAPAKPERAGADDRQAVEAGGRAPPPEDKAGETPPAVAQAPAKPERARSAGAQETPRRQAAAAGGGASGEERAEEAPAAIAAAGASKPGGAGASDRPAPAAGAPSAPAGTPAPPAMARAEAPAAPQGGQAAPATQPSTGGVSVDSVDYDDKGNLALSGTAKPGSTVEPKIAGAGSGSESLGEARADEKGEWRLRVERPVAPGRYDLTVEERGPGGEPRSRIRLPFERADPISDFPPGDIVVVQPGNSLWRIARRLYGQGVRYTVIYAANRAQIGDPDLIFPGQIFSVPEEGRAARAPG